MNGLEMLENTVLIEGVVLLFLAIAWYFYANNRSKTILFMVLSYYVHLAIYFGFKTFFCPTYCPATEWCLILRTHGTSTQLAIVLTYIWEWITQRTLHG